MVNHAKVRRVEDRRLQEQDEIMRALAQAEDYASVAILKAEMQKEAEAQVASVEDVASCALFRCR